MSIILSGSLRGSLGGGIGLWLRLLSIGQGWRKTQTSCLKLHSQGVQPTQSVDNRWGIRASNYGMSAVSTLKAELRFLGSMQAVAGSSPFAGHHHSLAHSHAAFVLGCLYKSGCAHVCRPLSTSYRRVLGHTSAWCGCSPPLYLHISDNKSRRSLTTPCCCVQAPKPQQSKEAKAIAASNSSKGKKKVWYATGSV